MVNSYLTYSLDTGIDEQVCYVVSNQQPDTSKENFILWYNPQKNLLYHSQVVGTEFERFKGVIIGRNFNKSSDGTITSLRPVMPVKLLDINMQNDITSWSFPSGKYIYNIFPTAIYNGAPQTYKAPANGFVQFGSANTCPIWINFNGEGQSVPVASGTGYMVNTPKMPVKKGDVITAFISTQGGIVGFDASIFEYAQGEV